MVMRAPSSFIFITAGSRPLRYLRRRSSHKKQRLPILAWVVVRARSQALLTDIYCCRGQAIALPFFDPMSDVLLTNVQTRLASQVVDNLWMQTCAACCTGSHGTGHKNVLCKAH